MNQSNKIVKIAVVCKLLPLYRLGIFQNLCSYTDGLEFTLFGDTKNQGGIESITKAQLENGILRWQKTSNYFYKPELLLWQTDILKRILLSDFKVFIFEGAVSHFPIWLFALLCKLMKKKVIFWTHGFKGNDQGIKRLVRFIFFKYFADELFLYGLHQKNLMVSKGFDPNKIHVIFNSLRPEIQFKAINSLNMTQVLIEKNAMFNEPGAFTLIFIGRLTSSKKAIEIAKACKQLLKSGLKVNLIIIGDGPEKHNIMKFFQLNDMMSQVCFTGSLYDENNIAKYFAMSDLMISPGNVGLNCMHSLAYGVPVLTHDNFRFQGPEVEAIVNGKTGLIYRYNDFTDMTDKLKGWIESNIDAQTTRIECQTIINKIYNPSYQTFCITTAIKKMLYNAK